MAESLANAAEDNTVPSEVVQWLRSSTPGQRIFMASALNEMAKELVAGEIRNRHPDWSELDVKNEVARRFLADENLPELYAKDLLTSPTHREAYERSLVAAGVDR